MLKNIIFDFDGVIHNTFQFHLDTINRFAPQVHLTAEEYRALHDGTVYNQSLLEPKRQIDFSGYPAFVHAAQGALVTDAYVKQSLVAFARTQRLFLVTSGSRLGVGDYLVNNGIQDLFDCALFKEDGLSKVEKLSALETEHDAAPSTSVFVSDTVGDVLEGHEAGFKVIAVTFGFHDRARLAKAAPDALVNSWQELVALLQDSVRINALLGK